MRSKVPSAAARARARKLVLDRVGQRVRALRDAQGMPRRALAERSGVSARFLAQLESGAGNISVARLADVAHALLTTPSALLAPPKDDAGAEQDPTLRSAVDEVLDGRSGPELREVRAWLEVRFAPPRGPLVALLGARGAGKSTVGEKLARRLDVPFCELDALIEETAGLSLAQIFELHGEAYYRRLERETLASWLSRTQAAVLATGGSLVTDPETWRLLRRGATTVWLRAAPEDHWNRVVKQGDQRPMARNPHAMQELRALIAARARLYAEADHTVDTSRVRVERVVEEIVRRVAPPAAIADSA
jgi:XRE family aerobic/anaerobic benzoate catabolism transcriptional regulator